MSNNIDELVEYSETHRKLIEEATQLGMDTTILLNPELDEVKTHLYNLARFNIEIAPEHYYKLSNKAIENYMFNGFHKPELNMSELGTTEHNLLITRWNLPYNMYNDMHGLIYQTKTGEKMGVSVDKDMLFNISDRPYPDLSTSYKTFINYAIAKNRTDIIQVVTPDMEFSDIKVGREMNLAKLRLFYMECPNIDEVIAEAENIKDKRQYYIEVQNEYLKTGCIRIMLDRDYTFEDRRTILRHYLYTGIDVRYIEDKERILPIIRDVMDNSRVSGLKDCLRFAYTPEYLKEIREMSNLFRQGRLQNLHKEVRDDTYGLS